MPPASFSWLEAHLEWQRKLLRRDPASAKFLLLRPGDAHTMCRTTALIGTDIRMACRTGKVPTAPRRPAEHWDEYMTRSVHGQSRIVPGFGNVVLSLVSAALAAAVSQRVLLIENYTVAATSFGRPFSEIIYETSAWRPYVEAEQYAGRAVDWWAAHDDYSSFGRLCSADMRTEPSARVLRIFSNQYFAPLLMLNPHHRAQIDALAAPPHVSPANFSRAVASKDGSAYSGGLWPPALATLLRPNAKLLRRVDEFVAESQLAGGGISLGMHVRDTMTPSERADAAECVRLAVDR